MKAALNRRAFLGVALAVSAVGKIDSLWAQSDPLPFEP